MIRVGIGFDVHALERNRPLKLGGVLIPHHSGLKGHSDADVLLHAITDALLGTTGKGDIGSFFPDSDPAFKDIDSTILLQIIAQKMFHKKSEIIWLDAIVIAEEPKILPYVDEMKRVIGKILDISPAQISIKGKTTEGLGFIGNKEGIAAQAAVTVETGNEEGNRSVS